MSRRIKKAWASWALVGRAVEIDVAQRGDLGLDALSQLAECGV
jgi:hypothetical protein